ncbi:GGDEF domain-containing protein [Jannaschia sp. S6380]|uniref:GGDEF domain-containing protein n=1 Tax=Jannaschia sp. S6380 TaxID=2926408 RepID=UPI001FF5EA6A|nr:GGDEF domain-containing protein [Jannaschia sp. S6380]MCK0166140.1 GGDEF domain-containing protein [Jannaschia sp. S6380]
MSSVTLPLDVLDRTMPMCLVADGNGRIVHVGPTLLRIAPNLVGQHLDAAIHVAQSALVAEPASTLLRRGRRLRLALAGEVDVDGPDASTRFRGIGLPLSDGGLLLHLAFCADPGPALRRHGLTARDLSPIDPTVDLLFLIEANAVVLSEFGRLGDRLDAARAAAEDDAATDTLTGLRNRRALDVHLTRLIDGRDVRFGLMHLDLDYFKSVNDRLGHAAGDHVLKKVAEILQQEVRRGDLVARVGGDEFVLVFAGCADVEILRRIADRIIDRLEAPIEWQGEVCRVSASIGITMSDFYEAIELGRMGNDADAALYASKRAGRSRHSVAGVITTPEANAGASAYPTEKSAGLA